MREKSHCYEGDVCQLIVTYAVSFWYAALIRFRNLSIGLDREDQMHRSVRRLATALGMATIFLLDAPVTASAAQGLAYITGWDSTTDVSYGCWGAVGPNNHPEMDFSIGHTATKPSNLLPRNYGATCTLYNSSTGATLLSLSASADTDTHPHKVGSSAIDHNTDLKICVRPWIDQNTLFGSSTRVYGDRKCEQ